MIDYVPPEKAKGDIAEVYKTFPESIGVPAPVQQFSASPTLLKRKVEELKYFMSHDEMEPALLAAIRYLAAHHYGHSYCINLNAKLLMAMGLEKHELDQLAKSPEAVFEVREATLLNFVTQSLNSPDDIGQEDIDALREQAWSDTAIFDAMAQAVNIGGSGTLFRTFSK
ncbi:hypothetical protein [uncultured Pseudodesulfovibrio sp.]|uniref:carboxymuconolactone decarboxylase family protein n=1 Tax=uncultured Pseudodesulfovibrio sp. TaxID=2035858 RepID=UPI0029C9538F|nr:hypothetical protein [uncultured Pseudodesulfovibrio sp.]